MQTFIFSEDYSIVSCKYDSYEDYIKAKKKFIFDIGKIGYTKYIDNYVGNDKDLLYFGLSGACYGHQKEMEKIFTEKILKTFFNEELTEINKNIIAGAIHQTMYMGYNFEPDCIQELVEKDMGERNRKHQEGELKICENLMDKINVNF